MSCSPEECHLFIREVTGKSRNSHVASVVEDQKGQLLLESKDNLKNREVYVTSCYRNQSIDTEIVAFEGQLSYEPVLCEDVESALCSKRLSKASREDVITVDIPGIFGSQFSIFLCPSKIYTKGKNHWKVKRKNT